MATNEQIIKSVDEIEGIKEQLSNNQNQLTNITYYRGQQLIANTINKLVTGSSITIGGLGDSIMYGYGSITGDYGYFDIIKYKLESKYSVSVTLSKQAVSGYTVRDAFINGKVSNIEKANCDLVIISFGHNDIKSDLYDYKPGIGYPLQQSMSDTEHIIRRLKSINPFVDIILLGEPPYLKASMDSNKYLANYTKEYKILASKYNCLFIDTALIFTSKSDYSSYIREDGHPNDLGYDEITSELMKYLSSWSYIQSNNNFALPNNSLRKSWKYGKETWKQITGTKPTDGNRIMFNGSGWYGTPKTTTITDDFIDIIARCNCIAIKIKVTQGTHILMAKDSISMFNDVTFPSFYSFYPNHMWLTIPFENNDSGLHSARLYLRGGSLEVDEVWCLASPHEFIPCDSPLITYDSNWTTLDNTDTKAVNYYSKFRAPTVDVGYKVTIPFIGTGLAGDFNVQNGIGIFEVEVDGIKVSDLEVAKNGAYNLASGVTICSNLPYGQHTITLTAKTGNTVKIRIGGFLVLDERRIEEPNVQRGFCKVGTNQSFGVNYDAIPFININGNGVYATNITKSGFVAKGITGEIGTYEAKGNRIAY